MKATKILILLNSIAILFGFNMALACDEGAVSSSKRMIEAVLSDVIKTYPMTGGGGISEIKMMATNTYRITILQEESPHVFTYELKSQANCKIKIMKKTENSSSKKK